MKRNLYNDAGLKPLRRVLRSGMTDAERKLWQVLRMNGFGVRFLRQYGVGSFILDFYCPRHRLAVELDGGQHNEDAKKTDDVARTRFLEEKGIRVLRLWNNEVLNNIEGAAEAIRREVTPPGLPLP